MRLPTCVFCQIINDQLPATDLRLHMIADAVSFIPLNPVTPGHRLFVPRDHVAQASDDPAATGLIFAQAASWGNMQPDHDFNLIVNNGVHATQTVFHLHIHYVPRRANDGLTLPWTGQKH